MIYKKAAFTICTRSYTRIAGIVKDTFLSHNSDYDFWIIIVDNPDDAELDAPYLGARTLMNVTDQKYREMTFKYSLVEFCTRVKPFAFDYFLDRYDLAVYLDPDIMCFSGFEEIEEEGYSIYLTPHILDYHERNSYWKQNMFLKFGTFNCGFAAFRKSSLADDIIEWWKERMISNGFADEADGTYTDQKWMDMVLSLFGPEGIKVIRHLGYNVAPWNYSEREIVYDGNTLSCKYRGSGDKSKPLVFVHYSSYRFAKMVESNDRDQWRSFTNIYDDTFCLEDRYAAVLKESKALEKTCIGIRYSYDLYENGDSILPEHRKMYRRIIESEDFTQNDLAFDPYSESFGALMKKMYIWIKIANWIRRKSFRFEKKARACVFSGVSGMNKKKE